MNGMDAEAAAAYHCDTLPGNHPPPPGNGMIGRGHRIRHNSSLFIGYFVREPCQVFGRDANIVGQATVFVDADNTPLKTDLLIAGDTIDALAA